MAAGPIAERNQGMSRVFSLSNLAWIKFLYNFVSKRIYKISEKNLIIIIS